MTTSLITADLVESHGLTAEEYDRILATLGREPNLTELGMFSAMWSEHCSYKSSKVHLATLPTTGQRVLQGPGENAGVLDIGDGLALVFKMESHNQPAWGGSSGTSSPWGRDRSPCSIRSASAR
jgi:phosphoribosylformylglycinamidine synthase